MRYAIASDGEEVATHFGRCEHYELIDVEDGGVMGRERIASPGHGAPGELPRLLRERGVNYVIAGGAGPMAQNMFAEMGIEMILGVSGSLEDAIAKVVAGELEAGDDECVHSE